MQQNIQFRIRDAEIIILNHTSNVNAFFIFSLTFLQSFTSDLRYSG